MGRPPTRGRSLAPSRTRGPRSPGLGPRDVLVPPSGVGAAVAETLLQLGQRRPARAAILAPVCRRSCTRRSGRSAASRAIRQCRSIVDGCRCDNPVPPREEESVRTWLGQRVEVVSDREGRREEAWRPHAFLPPTSASPRWAHRRPRTARGSPTVPAPTSMSLRRSSSTSPLRGAHHAQSSTSARTRSGIALTITSSQSMRAGRISRARGVLAAARMRHGLLSIASSATAVFMTAFSSA